jgi:hypothetical protein
MELDIHTGEEDGGITVTEWLIKRARRFWDKGNQLPLDLMYELLGAGLDVTTLEKQYLSYA